MVDVRLGTEDDLDAVMETVASAFADDPAWNFMIGAGNEEGARLFARALFLPRVRMGTAWVADDGIAVAMWDRVSAESRHKDDDWWDQFSRDAGEDVWARLEAYDDALMAVAPPRPHWYLGVLATRPGAQGRGLASAVMQPGFEAADSDGWSCWLETSTSVNKAFYAGRGFTEVIEAEIPDGPPTWWLGRPSSGAGPEPVRPTS